MSDGSLLRSSTMGCVALAACLLAGCGDDAGGTGSGGAGSSSTGDPTCDGVLVDGVCEGKCTVDQCTAGNICANNRCSLPCQEHFDCYPGYACGDAVDEAGAAVRACGPSQKSPILGASCYFGIECAGSFVCPDGTPCGASVCGGQACTDGACPDGTACTAPTCEANVCREARCIGTVEDPINSPSAASYCTQDDCTQDTDCAPGMYCGKTRDFHEICGVPTLFGTEQPCIDPATFTTDGKTFAEGPASAIRNTCLIRRQCAPCTTDLDCSGTLGQFCAQVGGELRCAAQCGTDLDCERDAQCVDDPAHPGVAVCMPKYGSCAGTGAFCEPCVNDLDCGAPGSPGLCGSPGGTMRACLDLTTECSADSDCVTPGGLLRGICLGSADVDPSDPLYQRCYWPYNEGLSRYTCW
jgi:hypothetical protein